MIKIELEDKIIYRPERGCKLKVNGKPNLYSEVQCDKEREIKIVEVEENA